MEYVDGVPKSIYEYGQRQRRLGKKIGLSMLIEYMIKEGKTNEEIQKETELPLEEIEKIRKEN